MLAKRYRLVRSVDFARVRSADACWSDRRVVLCRAANGLECTRFGIITSKNLGSAVVRNRARRLVSEVIRLQRERVASGWDVVLIARRGILRARYGDVERSLLRVLAQANLLEPARARPGAEVEVTGA
ncbi:MAG: ribonuclease P protein component [Chloroflexota bacterium]